jgi:hypothetical protein
LLGWHLDNGHLKKVHSLSSHQGGPEHYLVLKLIQFPTLNKSFKNSQQF